ncbi:MAG: hypothetical protein SF051_15845 [Elusimicrobiota bacterium]|nr:hypothetical protein [Elusimicrobiota bacterium]
MNDTPRRALRIEIPLHPAALCLALTGVILAVSAERLYSEKLTLTTTYPAPSGMYTQLTTTAETVLARDGGFVGIGRRVPVAALDVNGGIRVGGVPDAGCAPATAGTLRYAAAAKALEFCDGTAWRGFGGSAGSVTLGRNHCEWVAWDSKRGTLSEGHCPAGKYVAGHVGLGVSTGDKKNFGRIYCCEP